MPDDDFFMRRAIALAEGGRFSVSPNPLVGCVLVRDDEIVGEGFHRQAGMPHAEVEALLIAADNARGATAYVTLEPCTHTGRTPPCTDALIAAGIARVVIACNDPHELAAGGATRLREAGITVTEGVCRSEAARQNEKFLYSVSHRSPFVLIKAGMTLDGKLATIARQSRWITSDAARARSHSLREEYDSILVGSGTVAADDPQLARRAEGNPTSWTRVIVDGDGSVPPHSRLLNDGSLTILYTAEPERYSPSATAIVVRMAASEGRLDLSEVLTDLYDRGIRSTIVEGGSELHSDFIRRKLWQKIILFVAPMIVGGSLAPSIFGGEGVSNLSDAYRLTFDSVEMIGPDILVTGYPAPRAE